MHAVDRAGIPAFRGLKVSQPAWKLILSVMSEGRSTVIAFPWYLLAVGIFIVIIGSLLASVRKAPGSGRRVVDPTMRDDEIIQNLQSGQRVSLPNLVILVGFI